MQSTNKHHTFDNGETIAFPRITIEDTSTMSDTIVSEREALARKLAKDENLSNVERANIVYEIQSRGVTVDELVALQWNPKYAVRTLRASLAKAGHDEAKQTEIITRFSSPEACEFAQALILDLPSKPVPAKTEEKKESPLSEPPASAPSD